MARVKKYVFTPATADEIRKAVGITRSDTLAVTKVLKRLGYDVSESVPKVGTVREKSASAAKRVVARPNAKLD